MSISKVTLGDCCFDTLIAVTDDERTRGLMFRQWPPPVMAFPFKKPAQTKFWMKNTVSPLDIVFCRAGSITGIYRGTPLSLDLIGPDEPSDLVVELPVGTAEKENINVGDRVKLSYSVETLSRKFRHYLLSE